MQNHVNHVGNTCDYKNRQDYICGSNHHKHCCFFLSDIIMQEGIDYNWSVQSWPTDSCGELDHWLAFQIRHICIK